MRLLRLLFPRTKLGWAAVLVSVLAFIGLVRLPSPYIVERPGPTFDALGDTEAGPIVTVDGEADESDDDGTLTVLTVTIAGSPDYPLSWIEVAGAYVSDAEAIVPMDVYFAPGETSETSSAENAAAMSLSQQTSIAAALLHEGEDIGARVTISEVVDDSPASGQLAVGDTIESVNARPVYDVASIRAALASTREPAEFVLIRDGETVTVTVEPDWSTGVPLVGIVPTTSFDFPVDVGISLPDIGGPSAGLIFSLAVIDRLEPGALTGGVDWAGTGTISVLGDVGPIGGIARKMHGAVASGAEWFLAPAANCSEVIGNVPGDLRVVSVATLEEAVTAITTVASGDEAAAAALPTCGQTP